MEKLRLTRVHQPQDRSSAERRRCLSCVLKHLICVRVVKFNAAAAAAAAVGDTAQACDRDARRGLRALPIRLSVETSAPY